MVDTEKTCEVMCIHPPGGARFCSPCNKPAAYYVKGCVGPVAGKAFVCEEHKNFYSPRISMSLYDYWVAQAEAALDK